MLRGKIMNEQERRWEVRGNLKILSLYWLMAVGRCCWFSNYMGTLSFTSAHSIHLASVVNIHLEEFRWLHVASPPSLVYLSVSASLVTTSSRYRTDVSVQTGKKIIYFCTSNVYLALHLLHAKGKNATVNNFNNL